MKLYPMLAAMLSTITASAHTLLTNKQRHRDAYLREVSLSSGVMRYTANRPTVPWLQRQVSLFVVARRLPQANTHSICTICRRPSRANARIAWGIVTLTKQATNAR